MHVALPGQEPGAEDLDQDCTFPTMAELGLNLVTVLDHLRISRVVGLGDGAGANIITRYVHNKQQIYDSFLQVWPLSPRQSARGGAHKQHGVC